MGFALFLSFRIRVSKWCDAPALYHILMCKYICNSNIWYERSTKGAFDTLLLLEKPNEAPSHGYFLEHLLPDYNMADCRFVPKGQGNICFPFPYCLDIGIAPCRAGLYYGNIFISAFPYWLIIFGSPVWFRLIRNAGVAIWVI